MNHVLPLLALVYLLGIFGLLAVATSVLAWMLYSWRDPAAVEATGFPGHPKEPRRSFSLIVPARHEEAVLGSTLAGLAVLDHPRYEVLVVIGHDDPATEAVAREWEARQPGIFRVVVDTNWPKNKPKALNTALPFCTGEIIGIFDAEDEVHPRLLRQVDSYMTETDADICQAGIQLMNYHTSWWALRNVLEYFFHFRSRVHFYASRGFVPLGGNTMFVRTSLVRSTGAWDPICLAEDCDIGVRLSSIGAKTVVAYDSQLATREETPVSVEALFKQRVRWDQGFLQVLRKREWAKLPTARQKLLAQYILLMPFLQAISWVLLPFAIVTALWVKLEIVLALLTFTLTIPYLTTLAVEIAGLIEFCGHYGFKPGPRDFFRLMLGTPFYQMILAAAALTAVVREIKGNHSWYKTEHVGAHWHPPVPSLGALQRAPVASAADAAVLPLPLTLVPQPLELDGLSWNRVRAWLGAHRVALITLGVLLATVGVVQGAGMAHFPGRLDDEGTYVAEAWALQRWHQLSHYTYWYDHPPLAWMQIALWTWATSAMSRLGTAIAAGREVMLVTQLINSLLVYALARRLQMRRALAVVAVALFTFAPIALTYHRLVYLDNIAATWVLASFVLALSPQRRLSAHAASAICFAAAILSKETSVILLPTLLYILWQNSDPRNRRFAIALFGTLLILVAAAYPLYAALKGELVSGPGHVSLMDGLRFQLVSRAPTGSIFAAGSPGQARLAGWLALDPWLLGVALALIPAAFAVRRLRPLAVGYLLLVAAVVRPGYLPYPYVIALIAVAPLLIAGVANSSVDAIVPRLRSGGRSRGTALALGAAMLVPVGALMTLAVPGWARYDAHALTTQSDTSVLRAESWVIANVPRDKHLIVDDTMWLDLVRAGFPRSHVIWHDKIDSDPDVLKEVPSGWRDVDYIISTSGLRADAATGLEQVQAALDHSTVVKAFGIGGDDVEVRAIARGSA